MPKKKATELDVKNSYTDVTFKEFVGMRNKGLRLDERRPYFISNMDIYPDGSLKGRKKLKKIKSINNSHSPFKLSDNEFLFFATEEGKDKLYKLFLSSAEALLITETDSPGARFWFVRIGDKVYISNRFWNGIYDVKRDEIREWKLDTSYTFENSEEASDYAVAEAIPMPKVEHLCFYKGRIYGIRGKRLWYSEALVYDFTLPYYYIDLPEEPCFIASNQEVILIGMKNMAMIGTVSSEGIHTFKIELVNCIPNSAFVYRDKIFFLTKEGISMVEAGKVVSISDAFFDVIITGEARAGGVSSISTEEKGFLPVSPSNIILNDNVVAEIVKNKTKTEGG